MAGPSNQPAAKAPYQPAWRQLKRVDSSTYSCKGASFDLSAVGDAQLKVRIAGAVDLLFDLSVRCEDAAMITRGILARGGTTMRFFDSAKACLSGSPAVEPTFAVNAFSLWKSDNGTWLDQSTPVEKRVDPRTYINPSQNVIYSDLIPTVWHELTHIFTQLNHGAWDYKTNTYANPTNEMNAKWIRHIDLLKAAADPDVVDPATGQKQVFRAGNHWTCNCGGNSSSPADTTGRSITIPA